jgi:UTP--glucose-1-phosphate uridylyltransferase
VGRYGTLSGKRVPDAPGVYQIEKIIEKPALSTAELQLQTPGLRVGHYLCFFGMHVLPHQIFGILEEQFAKRSPLGAEFQLTPALQELANREKYLALEVKGSRYDIGGKLGLMQAQIALGVAGKDRDEFLTTIIEVLAEAGQRGFMNAGE